MPVTSKREIFPGKNPFHAYHCDALRAANNTRDINGYSIYRRIIKNTIFFVCHRKSHIAWRSLPRFLTILSSLSLTTSCPTYLLWNWQRTSLIWSNDHVFLNRTADDFFLSKVTDGWTIRRSYKITVIMMNIMQLQTAKEEALKLIFTTPSFLFVLLYYVYKMHFKSQEKGCFHKP